MTPPSDLVVPFGWSDDVFFVVCEDGEWAMTGSPESAMAFAGEREASLTLLKARQAARLLRGEEAGL